MILIFKPSYVLTKLYIMAWHDKTDLCTRHSLACFQHCVSSMHSFLDYTTSFLSSQALSFIYYHWIFRCQLILPLLLQYKIHLQFQTDRNWDSMEMLSGKSSWMKFNKKYVDVLWFNIFTWNSDGEKFRTITIMNSVF